MYNLNASFDSSSYMYIHVPTLSLLLLARSHEPNMDNNDRGNDIKLHRSTSYTHVLTGVIGL